MRAFIQDQGGDHKFDNTIEVKPVDFVNHIRQNGGYYVAEEVGGEEALVFVPWHNIHFIRFTDK